ncbi:efflux RND transporter periplasmic adaptor subunit [candidate division KSB1 bacterium]|nr:efflux RND transporter periplasmic adaptor subunit [candidate division KSB1 bacterium]
MQSFNFRQTHNFNLYIILWIVALILSFFLFRTWHIDQKYIGIVERKPHPIGAQESGKVRNMFVTIGEQVEQDQVLAILDVSDLMTHLNLLQNELANIHGLENAQRNRYSIEVQNMALRLENEASDLMDRLSMIESKSTELAGLNAEIARLKDAEEAGLGYSSDMSALVLQRDALASYLREQSKDLQYQTEKLNKARQSRAELEKANIDSLTKALLLDQVEYAESLQRQISETEHRISLRTIVAPCAGYVTEIFIRPGDVVDAFVPVLNIEELRPLFVDVYIPEKSELLPEPGMEVEIYSSRNSKYNTKGTLSFVHPGFAQAPQRLSFRGQIFWARKVRVKLPDDHHLILGEVVNTKIHKTKVAENHLTSTSAMASEKPNNSKAIAHPPLRDIKIPSALQKTTRVEPSGVVWLPDENEYLIVSDDTGLNDTNTEHAPQAFLMDSDGKIEPNPVLIKGIKSVNDMEAIAPAGDDLYYLVSSQNISKKAKRPVNREQILRVQRDGASLSVTGMIHFLSMLRQSYSTEEIAALGLEQSESDSKPLLNIEAAAWRDGALYLGLKQPVSERGALIWKLDNVAFVFDNQKILPGQLSLFGHVQLGQYKNHACGISDLMFDDQGTLWALSTIPNVDTNEQIGGLHRIKHFADGSLEATRIYEFPGLKPEGLCQRGPHQFTIVFDNDNETPAFCQVDMEAL